MIVEIFGRRGGAVNSAGIAIARFFPLAVALAAAVLVLRVGVCFPVSLSIDLDDWPFMRRTIDDTTLGVSHITGSVSIHSSSVYSACTVEAASVIVGTSTSSGAVCLTRCLELLLRLETLSNATMLSSNGLGKTAGCADLFPSPTASVRVEAVVVGIILRNRAKT